MFGCICVCVFYMYVFRAYFVYGLCICVCVCFVCVYVMCVWVCLSRVRSRRTLTPEQYSLDGTRKRPPPEDPRETLSDPGTGELKTCPTTVSDSDSGSLDDARHTPSESFRTTHRVPTTQHGPFCRTRRCSVFPSTVAGTPEVPVIRYPNLLHLPWV